MKTYNRLQSKLARLGALSLIAGFMVSCGSYQNTSYYDNDGVYNNAPQQRTVQNSNRDANYYSNYFKQAGEDLPYFTDIEGYTSETSDTTARRPLQVVGYGGWGDETDNVSINIYNNGGWGYSPYYNSWYGGYGTPYYWGSGFSFGFSWGWGGYYSPWNSWYGGWGYPYYPHYHSYYPYYPNYRYSNRTVVQNRGQRTGQYTNSRSVNQLNRTPSNLGRTATSNRRVDPNFNSNRRTNNTNSIRNNTSNRTNTIRNTRDNTNFSRPNSNYTRPNNESINNNSSRSYNSGRNNSSSTIQRSTPSRSSNYSTPSSSRGGNYGGSSRMSSGRSGGRR